MINAFFEHLAKVSRQYLGFKCILLLIYNLLILLAFFYAIEVGAVPGVRDFLSNIWLTYIYEYWKSHLWLLFLSFAMILILISDAFENKFYELVQRVPMNISDSNFFSFLNTAKSILLLILILQSIIVFPILHLVASKWLRVVATMIVTLATVALGLLSLRTSSRNYVTGRLGRYRVRNSTTFSSASLGTRVKDVEIEISNYRKISGDSLRSKQSLEFLSGEKTYFKCQWKGYKNFYSTLANFLGTEVDRITTHECTSKAILRALESSVSENTVLITTDMEYNSIINILKEIAEEKNIGMHMINIRDRFLFSSEPIETLTDIIVKEIQLIIEKFSNADRYIVILSHVFFENGRVVMVESVVDSFKAKDNIVFIIDGAQAVGNIQINPIIFKKVHFYATSGHKWMLGQEALGILVHNPHLLQKNSINKEDILDHRLPYSFYGYDPNNDKTGFSWNLEPIISLNVTLQEFQRIKNEFFEHNIHLARQFVDHVPRNFCLPSNENVESGIVLLKLNLEKDANKISYILERDYNIHVSTINSNMIRYSFNYFSNSIDVFHAADSLNLALKSDRIQNESESLKDLISTVNQLKHSIEKIKR